MAVDNLRAHGPVALDAVVDLMRALMTRRFCAALLGHVNTWVCVDHCALVRLSPGSGVQLFGAESVASFVTRGARAVASYVDRFHRIDPLRRLLRDARASIFLRRERRADLDDSSYRRACYDEPEIVDRMSLATSDGRGGLIALIMHRQRVSGEFSEEDRTALAGVAPLLAVACARHIELIMHAGANAPTWRLRLASACSQMTGRELDVAAHLLAGRTMRETAAGLGIAHSSVVTYSERAYARLGVGSLRELRARFAELPTARGKSTGAGVAEVEAGEERSCNTPLRIVPDIAEGQRFAGTTRRIAGGDSSNAAVVPSVPRFAISQPASHGATGSVGVAD